MAAAGSIGRPTKRTRPAIPSATAGPSRSRGSSLAVQSHAPSGSTAKPSGPRLARAVWNGPASDTIPASRSERGLSPTGRSPAACSENSRTAGVSSSTTNHRRRRSGPVNTARSSQSRRRSSAIERSNVTVGTAARPSRMTVRKRSRSLPSITAAYDSPPSHVIPLNSATGRRMPSASTTSPGALTSPAGSTLIPAVVSVGGRSSAAPRPMEGHSPTTIRAVATLLPFRHDRGAARRRVDPELGGEAGIGSRIYHQRPSTVGPGDRGPKPPCVVILA